MREALGPGTAILNGFAHGVEAELVSALKAVVERAPLRHMVTPRGFRMSVAMTNCGRLGWVTALRILSFPVGKVHPDIHPGWAGTRIAVQASLLPEGMWCAATRLGK